MIIITHTIVSVWNWVLEEEKIPCQKASVTDKKWRTLIESGGCSSSFAVPLNVVGSARNNTLRSPRLYLAYFSCSSLSLYSLYSFFVCVSDLDRSEGPTSQPKISIQNYPRSLLLYTTHTLHSFIHIFSLFLTFVCKTDSFVSINKKHTVHSLTTTFLQHHKGSLVRSTNYELVVA